MKNLKSLERAKHPRNILAGPYGHPFHPMLVTIPIGTWTASLVFDILALIVEDPSPYLLGATVLIAIGLLGALAAAVFGFLDFSVIPARTHAKKVAVRHMSLNLALVVLYAINLFLRLAAGYDDVPITAVVLNVVGLALLGLSGYLGGELAYHYGVRVADEEKQAEGFDTERR